MAELKGVFAELAGLRERGFRNFGTPNSTEISDCFGDKIEAEYDRRKSLGYDLGLDEKDVASAYFKKDFECSADAAARNFNHALICKEGSIARNESIDLSARMTGRAADVVRRTLKICRVDGHVKTADYLAWLTDENYALLDNLKKRLVGILDNPKKYFEYDFSLDK